jgi:hypothetical protein
MLRLLCVVALLVAVPVCLYAQCEDGIKVTKTVDQDWGLAGTHLTYTIEVTNLSYECSFHNVVVFDALLGGQLAEFPTILPPGTNVMQEYYYVVPLDSPDPLVNTVTVMCEDEFGGVHEAEDTVEVDIWHPGFTIEVECVSGPPEPGMDALLRMTVTNTGEVPLDFVFNGYPSSPPPVTLMPGNVFIYTLSSPCEDEDACANIAVIATVPPEFNHSYEYEDYAVDCCDCTIVSVQDEESSWGVIKALYRR